MKIFYKYSFYSFLLILILFSSCTALEQLTYLNDLEDNSIENFKAVGSPDYQLQKQDILYIKISTINEEINASLNFESRQNNPTMLYSEAGSFYNGYAVDDSGYIHLPLIGEIKVLGKTISEATVEIDNKVKEYLKDATIIIKLMTFDYTILGEVKNPGKYLVYASQLTVFEALGLAGDITEFGNKSDVLLIRSKENEYTTVHLNLQEKDIFTSEYFYILPNDVLIIDPRRTKFVRPNIQNTSMLLSTVASTISLILLIIRFQ